MINIYSIKEVIEASNNILNRTKYKNKVISVKSSSSDQIDILKKDKPLILNDEVFNENQLKNNPNKTNLKKKIIKPLKHDKLIDKLYLRFNKKIKKNTLKLIFELQKEVSSLNQFKDLLKASNKKFKTQIANLNTELKKYKLQSEIELKDKMNLKEKIIKLSNNLKSSEEEIKSLNQNKIELEKEISNYKTQEEISNKKIYDISEVENKNKFFQEENLRIGSDLLEIKKKHDILKKEIEKYENQKSNLISKINSVNEALSDTNILTNVFENKVENKVKVIDHSKIEKKNSSNLNEQIKDIFLDKS